MAEDLRDCENLNVLWGTLVVSELARLGVRQFYVAPGSRSSPLAVAVARAVKNGVVAAVSAHDERGAAFCAVGYARAAADGRAAAVVTSSGTAVANLLPAVVEASQEGIPLVLLTGDRPPELRDTGANQSIDQVKMFSAWTRWFKDMPCPSNDIRLSNVLSDVDHAIGCARGWELLGAGGPVHLNFMFREPLAPDVLAWNKDELLSNRILNWASGPDPFTIHRSMTEISPLTQAMGSLSRLMGESTRGVVVVGQLWLDDDRIGVTSFLEQLGWPALTDPLSGVRPSPFAAKFVDIVIGDEDGPVKFDRPDFILQLGGRLVSKTLCGWISRSVERWSPHYVLVDRRADRQDETFSVTQRVVGSPASFCAACCESGIGRLGCNELLEVQRAVDKPGAAVMREALEQQESCFGCITEPMIANEVTKWLGCVSVPGREKVLFVGNSMPIRDVDQFGVLEEEMRVVGNRGASGIDGVVSAAIGASHEKRCGLVCLLIGDMSFIHDLNALQLLTTHGTGHGRLVIVVVNNGGGGIFALLPVARATATFSPWFDSAHETSFEGVCRGFRLPYATSRDGSALRLQLEEFEKSGAAAAVIEVQVGGKAKAGARGSRDALRDTYRRAVLRSHLEH